NQNFSKFEFGEGLGVSLNYPLDNHNSESFLINFNCSASIGIGLTEIFNISLWTDNSGDFDISNFTTGLSGIFNSTVFTFDFDSFGSYNWTCRVCDNDENCVTGSNRTINILPIVENSQTYNSTTIETSLESFSINVSYDSSRWLTIAANLIYNETSYTGIQSGTGNTINFEKTINIPQIESQTNISFYWGIILTDATGTYNYNSTFNNQTITTLQIINITSNACSAGFFETINYTFSDEGNLTSLNSTIDYNFKFGIGNYSSEVIMGSFTDINSF
ncbi:unnamed protein product, partial [marine sediment metagenome]